MTVGDFFIRCIGIPSCFALAVMSYNSGYFIIAAGFFGAGVAWSIEFYYAWKKGSILK
jgi:hypothetical protein